MKIKKYLNFKDFTGFLRGLIRSRNVMIQMVIKDIQSQYLGSFLGITWSFIQPFMYVAVISLVFSIGLRGSRGSEELPFVLFLVSGITVWFFISDCVSYGVTSIQQHSYLVQKIVFRVSMLPVVKIFSALFVHMIFLFLLVSLFALHGLFPDLYYLQILYYLFSTIVLMLGLAWFTSSVVLFFPDLQQIMQLMVRIGFWFTPIIWNLKRVPVKYRWLIEANPACYLVQGYRNCFIHKTWFWERPYYSLYFWIFTLLVFAVGSIVFRRLKPHFADVI
jgi:ABC-type polysaccharide/polyol phosphate export permease